MFYGLVNGILNGFFQSKNGLQQGDSISPSLFILMVEALGRSICKVVRSGLWWGIKVSPDTEPVTHQKFVDDTILFWDTSRREAFMIKKVFDKYCQAFGQKLNWKKIDIFFFNTNLCKQIDITRILNFKTAKLLSNFLGLPLFVG